MAEMKLQRREKQEEFSSKKERNRKKSEEYSLDGSKTSLNKRYLSNCNVRKPYGHACDMSKKKKVK